MSSDSNAAFPTASDGYCHQPGMQLRDWFAGLVLHGMVTSKATMNTLGEVAEYAYTVADAMVKERAKNQPK